MPTDRTPLNDLPGVGQKSIIRAIWNGLKAGRELTAIEALNSYKTICLSQFVSELRNHYNKPIQDRWLQLPNGKRIKAYYLPRESRNQL